MTHEGPQDSSTCNAILKDTGIPLLKDGLYKFGSKGLANLINDKRELFVCSVHGHNHFGAFLDYSRPQLMLSTDPYYIRPDEKIASVPIINPGSLQWGEYGEMVLVKVGGKWRVKEANKKFLV